MKVQSHFPRACRAEQAVSAPAEQPLVHPTAAAAPSPTRLGHSEPPTADTSMRTTMQADGDDYVSTVPNLPHLCEGGEQASRP